MLGCGMTGSCVLQRDLGELSGWQELKMISTMWSTLLTKGETTNQKVFLLIFFFIFFDPLFLGVKNLPQIDLNNAVFRCLLC